MTHQITPEEIKNNTFFWYSYISWFRGYDEKNEINLDEALESTGIINNKSELDEWQKNFFSVKNSEEVKFIQGRINEKLTFAIEFQESEILFFLNDLYIGNLGGHFEAWFFTIDELKKMRKSNLLFFLLLPMTGIEQDQIKESKILIETTLSSISGFEEDAQYITNCIVNGLLIDDRFYDSKIGLINNQNHSVRNIKKHPKYKDDVIILNLALKGL